MAWPKLAPKKFLNTRHLQSCETLPLRAINNSELCQRCFIKSTIVSELDAKLTTFVCTLCRNDDQSWDYEKRPRGISYSIKSMVNEMPDKFDTDHQNGEGRS